MPPAGSGTTSGLVDEFEKLLVRTPEEFLRRQNIEVRVHHEVVGIEPGQGRVVVRDLEAGRDYEESYDHLVIATGAKAVWPLVPGVDAQGIMGMTSLEDARTLRELLERQRPEQVVIVGGGYIGLEMAEAFHRHGIGVSIVGRAPEVLRPLDPDMGELVSKALLEMGLHLYLGETVSAFEQTDGHVSAVVTEKRTLPADLVLIATGLGPNTGLAGEAGLSLGVSDAIKVDDHMRTTLDRIWAAGDCVETVQLVTGEPYWISAATVASKQGRWRLQHHRWRCRFRRHAGDHNHQGGTHRDRSDRASGDRALRRGHPFRHRDREHHYRRPLPPGLRADEGEAS